MLTRHKRMEAKENSFALSLRTTRARGGAALSVACAANVLVEEALGARTPLARRRRAQPRASRSHERAAQPSTATGRHAHRTQHAAVHSAAAAACPSAGATAACGCGWFPRLAPACPRPLP